MSTSKPLQSLLQSPLQPPLPTVRPSSRLVAGLVRGLCRSVLTVMGVRVSVRGAWPREATLVIANHLSWLDIVAVLARKRCTFVAKSDVRRWPLVGWLGDAMGVIWVDRHHKRDLLRAIPVLQATLTAGTSVLLFAEGTTTNGQTLLPFKSGLVEGAVRAGVPVVPIAVTASASAGDLDALCWIGDETLVANIPRVFALRDARLTLHAAPAIEPLRGVRAARKLATAAARTAIVARTAGGAITTAPATQIPVVRPRTGTPRLTTAS
ncbi:MAG TPA: 1-acyl-sn-glycerol-3-phosphate acyltransferase [Gemmatimonas aurantiaca]|uniref:Acyltransferase n=2 Tax=Gemmatimonas aurantiaca TaxID=173480 RepID=C1AE87_GEMAT|nr:lysophospholipid acyltransferase family protein [Gemmatimonas aurantiaca]BAH40814.1 acyltransferase [Gemmatimonas aurantiaca T-27]HCT59091.1 1-acyl-sn-glycerol-3-phosphate acyltransferase [Gemmatimonas aurantiaca]